MTVVVVTVWKRQMDTVTDTPVPTEEAVTELPVDKLEGDQDLDEGYSGPPSPARSDDIDSDGATGVGTLQEDDQLCEQLSDDVSDTGWDTDLDIEEEKEEYDVTGGAAYLKTCESLGIIPASYFVRMIQERETNINLCHHGVGPKGAKAISVALTSNTNVTHLDLSDNGIATEGVIAVTTMMKENCYVTHLDLSDNEVGSPAAFAIALMVGSNNTLVSLGLRGNGFTDKAAEPLAEIIKSSYHIKHLDLSHNEFGEEAGEIFGPALGDSEALQTLNLSWNHIRRKGAIAVAVGIKNNQTLKVLNLAYNGLANEGTVAIADALKLNSTLEELDVSNNRITLDGAVVLSKSLSTNESLTVLKVGKNPIQPDGLKAFLDALRPVTSSAMQLLDFSGITVTLEIAKSIKEMFETHPNLSIPHGGTGGFKIPKPLPGPVEKLVKYCKENSVQLIDLFRSFDKEQTEILSEDNFRDALKHISAPLMGFEKLKLIDKFKTEAKPAASANEEDKEKEATQQDEGTKVYIDYNALVEEANALEQNRGKSGNIAAKITS